MTPPSSSQNEMETDMSTETKFIRVEDNGFVWMVPLEAVAANRAKYYAEKDKDTSYQDEFDYVMADDYEGVDWFANNMNWEEVEAVAKLVERPNLAEPDMACSDLTIVEVRS